MHVLRVSFLGFSLDLNHLRQVCRAFIGMVSPVVRLLGNGSSGAVLRILLAFYAHFCRLVGSLSLGGMGLGCPLMDKLLTFHNNEEEHPKLFRKFLPALKEDLGTNKNQGHIFAIASVRAAQWLRFCAG